MRREEGERERNAGMLFPSFSRSAFLLQQQLLPGIWCGNDGDHDANPLCSILASFSSLMLSSLDGTNLFHDGPLLRSCFTWYPVLHSWTINAHTHTHTFYTHSRKTHTKSHYLADRDVPLSLSPSLSLSSRLQQHHPTLSHTHTLTPRRSPSSLSLFSRLSVGHRCDWR